MKINEIIKSNRLKLNLTQEQLANKLGVSAPAVNKWEKCASYPDITLLPPLARLFNIDLNTLLSFNNDLTDIEMWEFINNIMLRMNSKTFVEIYNECIKKIQEYPTCEKLVLNIAIALSGCLKIYNIKNKEMFQDTLNSMYDKCTHSNDLEIKYQAIYLLINIYIEQKNYVQSQNYIDMLPDLPYNKYQAQGNLYIAMGNNEKAAELFEQKVLEKATQLNGLLLCNIDIAMKDKRKKDALFIADIIKQSTSLFDLWEYNTHSAYFTLYSKMQDEENTINALSKMLASFSHKYDLYNSDLYKHLKKKETSDDGNQLITMFIEMIKTDTNGDLNFVKENPEFISLIETYSS